MYSVRIKAFFSAAHKLRGYKGKCEELHGHNWKVEVSVARQIPDKAGMVMDFTDLKKELNIILEKLDHKYLNNISYFKKVNPTSENIARYIYDLAKLHVPGIDWVTVWESQNCAATYHE
ncbi:MAG: 6-carboxytetrahydropterin synthase QueD [Candidatus Omnitrophica bacterium]|nr:6-carboxytetrahydropterin synthase QueD [Candidatus Omnitrophota bacterium]